MPKIVEVPTPDGPVFAIEQTFETKREDWNEYDLADGGHVRVKTVVQRIYRVVDPQGVPQTDEQGDPRLLVRHGTIVSASD
jgi:hypothetical protein